MRSGCKAALSLTLLAAALGGREASAQNTYADVPFNQGSLFYRPSGARPPQTTTTTMTTTPTTMTTVPTTTTATTTTARRRFRLFGRRAARTAQSRYYYPTAAAYTPSAPTTPGTYYATPAPVQAR